MSFAKTHARSKFSISRIIINFVINVKVEIESHVQRMDYYATDYYLKYPNRVFLLNNVRLN